jgi:ribosomal protein S18 acetylase RimI-like enzyme
MLEIRHARKEEAAQLGEIAELIFRDTFAPFNTEADMDIYCAEAMSAGAFRSDLDDPMSEILVAADGGAIVAYAHIHRGETPAVVGSAPTIELKRFYLLRDRHGTGLARRLMREVARRSAALGAETLWLGVWEHNGRGIAFYRKLGFEEVGEQPFLLGTDRQRDLIMTIPLATLLATEHERPDTITGEKGAR